MKKIILIMTMVTIIPINTFAFLGLGSGGSADSAYWQMKTYFESIAINAQTLKSANNELKQINHMLEQAKKAPQEFFQTHMKEYTEMIKTLTEISSNTKSVLRDAKKAELWFKDVYSDVNNKNYQNLIDKFTTSLDNLSYDSMRTAGLASEASKKTANNAKTLILKAKTADNPVQLLEVLSGWSSNLSTQLGTITEVIASDTRLKALEEAERAAERKKAKERHDFTQRSLQNTINKMQKINGK